VAGARRHSDRRSRRRRLLTRAGPLGAVAIIAFALGVVAGTAPGRAERQLVTSYVKDWSRGDYAGMYSLLDSSTRRTVSLAQFEAAYRNAVATATLTSIGAIHVGSRSGDAIPVRMTIRTRLFGTLKEVLSVPLTGSGSGAAVHFSPQVLFPGLRPGEQLARHVTLPARADLVASDGTPLAQGATRTSPIPDVAAQVVGKLGPIPAADAGAYMARGYPADAKVGLDGLERIFQTRLAGTPGGTLLAGSRVLVSAPPIPGHAVKTTINPAIERSAIAAMGSNYAGIAAMDPRTGAVLALAGAAFSAVQPPGSTMKIITATAALQAGIVHLGDAFPIATSSTIDGYTLQNANGEACGGTFLNAFAVSCNSVFAPLGAKLGARRLVDTAERFGFDQTPPFPGATESTIPSASTIGDSLAVGSSAIGQGMVQASALEMTDVAATIAMGGRRPIPTLRIHQRPRFVPVTSHHVAALVQRMMVAVVEFGTGTPAQIPGVVVAGKTGTAELRNTAGQSNPADTDSWFVGYAPVGAPRVVVGALFPSAGAGAQTAAPAVQSVMVEALHVIK
jgi:Penicillin binding protein transpeptidase domain/Penicillin-binding Protein dimerisation domain/NTF2-like N-terminal transpeptidase domain